MSSERLSSIDHLTRNYNFWRVFAGLYDPLVGYALWYETEPEIKVLPRVDLHVLEAKEFYEIELGYKIEIQPVETRFGIKRVFYDPNVVNLTLIPITGDKEQVIAENEQYGYIFIDLDAGEGGFLYFADVSGNFYG